MDGEVLKIWVRRDLKTHHGASLLLTESVWLGKGISTVSGIEPSTVGTDEDVHAPSGDDLVMRRMTVRTRMYIRTVEYDV